jgi:hypothetical protein
VKGRRPKHSPGERAIAGHHAPKARPRRPCGSPNRRVRRPGIDWVANPGQQAPHLVNSPSSTGTSSAPSAPCPRVGVFFGRAVAVAGQTAAASGSGLARWNEIAVVVELRLRLPGIVVGVAMAFVEATSIVVLAIDVDFE